jgi:alkyl hydroperoxide reductase subunit AhpC
MASLKIGDPAPSLTIKEWIQGNPVELKNGSNVYVLEFWAGLSPASTSVIPRLNELQKTYKNKGVIVVGISDEDPDKIRVFMELSKTNEQTRINYQVAADDKRKTARSYMVAFGQNGIPYAFIVGKDGNILWHGHPLAGLNEAVDQITAGKFDLTKAIAVDSDRAELEDYRLLTHTNEAAAKILGRKLLAARTNDVANLCDLSFRIIRDTGITNRDFALANEALSRAEQIAPSNSVPVLVARGIYVFEKDNRTNGIALVQKALEMSQNPGEKTYLTRYLRVMEGRLEAEIKYKESLSKAQLSPETPSQKP